MSGFRLTVFLSTGGLLVAHAGGGEFVGLLLGVLVVAELTLQQGLRVFPDARIGVARVDLYIMALEKFGHGVHTDIEVFSYLT